MSDLRDLYQTVILDHSRRPRNFRRPETANRDAEGFNPLCGDKVTVYLELEDDVVKDAAFQGSGCAISTASASMMTELVKGKTRADAEKLFQRFHGLVTLEHDANFDSDHLGKLGKLAVFSGVRQFPMRVKCATLAWHTLRQALEGRSGAVSTE